MCASERDCRGLFGARLSLMSQQHDKGFHGDSMESLTAWVAKLLPKCVGTTLNCCLNSEQTPINNSDFEEKWHLPLVMPPAQKLFATYYHASPHRESERVNWKAKRLSGLLHYSIRTGTFTQWKQLQSQSYFSAVNGQQIYRTLIWCYLILALSDIYCCQCF